VREPASCDNGAMAKRAGSAPPVEPARAADATTERPALPTAQQRTLPQREITLQGDYPARIGRYVVLKGLGQGGMGTVYLAYDADLDRRVAIKVVREDMELGAILRARVMKEAQAMARMSHPNVVHVYEVGEDRSSGQSQVFIAMEYVPGTSLDGLQQAKPARDVVALDQLLQLYLQAAAGLEAAHRSGLIHRDTKQSLRSTESVGRTERGGNAGGTAVWNAEGRQIPLAWARDLAEHLATLMSGTTDTPLQFSLAATDPTGARAGFLHTRRGVVPTPVFMPVATHAEIRGMHSTEVWETGARILLSNTYHLMLRPGAEVFRRSSAASTT
jgi:hypothetical protein